MMETRTLLLLLAVAAFVLALLSLAIALRIWNVVVPARVKSSAAAYKSSFPRKGDEEKKKPATTSSNARNAQVRTMVVLGSGGHTTEMLKLMKRLDRDVYTPFAFVVAETDKTSQEKTMLDWQPRDAVDKFVVIPRSREVGQSWSSSVWTTLRAFRFCVAEVYTFRPQLVLCNGPGTCIPIIAAVLLFRFLGVQADSKVIFCESFARVQSLSLTGKLLYYVADEFVVHWPQLQKPYPKSRHLGVIC